MSIVSCHLHGEEKGKKTGMKKNIAVNDVEEIKKNEANKSNIPTSTF